MRKKKIKHRSKSLQTGKSKWSYGLVLIFMLLVYLFVQGDKGFLKYIELSREKKNVIKRIEAMRHEQKALQAEIDKLKTNENYIEKVAREELFMAKKGEKVYKISQPQQKK